MVYVPYETMSESAKYVFFLYLLHSQHIQVECRKNIVNKCYLLAYTYLVELIYKSMCIYEYKVIQPNKTYANLI